MTSWNCAAFTSWPLTLTVYAFCGPQSTPVGRFTFCCDTAAATSSMPMPRLARARGSSCTRAAYFCVPSTLTCDTPFTVLMRCATTCCTSSSSADSGSVLERKLRYMMGWSAGFVLDIDGGMMPGGRSRSVLEMADCTSCAAASMLRLSVNCSVMDVAPSALVDVMLSRPAMVVNCFSSGVATAAAIVSGLAPGSDALMVMVG